jgi:hypothetical protein
MPRARDEVEEDRERARRLWQRSFDRLAEYLRELQSRESQDDREEPRPKPRETRDD